MQTTPTPNENLSNMADRTAEVQRKSLAAQFQVRLDQGGTGAGRFGTCVPLDEAIFRVPVDICGHPGLSFWGAFLRIGDFDGSSFLEFFRGFANHAKVMLHTDSLKGVNAHPVEETIFKSFVRAAHMALDTDERMPGVSPLQQRLSLNIPLTPLLN